MKQPVRPVLTLNDLKPVTRILGVSVDDLFKLAQRTEPKLNQRES